MELPAFDKRGHDAETCLQQPEFSLISIQAIRKTVYIVHSPTNALFINLVKSFKFTLKYTIISLLHVSVSNNHHKGALSVPN